MGRRRTTARQPEPQWELNASCLDRVAGELLRASRKADPQVTESMRELISQFRKLEQLFGIQLAPEQPSADNDAQLIADCRTLALDLRSKAWEAMGLHTIFNRLPHKTESDVQALPVDGAECELAQKILGPHHAETFFASAVWHMLQLDPVSAILGTALTGEMARAVAQGSVKELQSRLARIRSNLAARPPELSRAAASEVDKTVPRADKQRLKPPAKGPGGL
ncbi:hypothetical protein ACIF85_47265 [Streptomyces sp. NPDC086033]|uniref:hypothetical protein n=1 Tax=Streptomyces TaxID=1883 RepID=UPI0032553AE3